MKDVVTLVIAGQGRSLQGQQHDGLGQIAEVRMSAVVYESVKSFS